MIRCQNYLITGSETKFQGIGKEIFITPIVVFIEGIFQNETLSIERVIMSEWMFRWFMQGKTIDEIVEKSNPPQPTSNQVRESIQKEREKFEDYCLRKLISKAKEGDTDAIDWFVNRGLFKCIKIPD